MFRYPVNYIAITQYYTDSHKGLDLGWNSKYGGENQKIYASSDGVIYEVNDNDTSDKSWGNYVKIKHADDIYTLYAHLKNGIKVKVGQEVKQGELLGYMGNTGHAKGNHCHYEMYVGGEGTSYRVDPLTRTYVYQGQIVSDNEDATKGLKYYLPEEDIKSFKLIYKCKKTGLYKINIVLKENEELYLK